MSKIAFFSENQHCSKVHRRYSNMRTEFAWQCALEADHHNITLASKIDYDLPKYDLGIIIPPKNQRFNIGKIRSKCGKIAFMQEGASWVFQDYIPDDQLWFFNQLNQADFLLCHNTCDQKYYAGLYNKPTYILSTLMIEDVISSVNLNNRCNTIIGGNWCSYYTGFDSYSIAKIFNETIVAPSTGRMHTTEKDIFTHIDSFVPWQQWISILSTFKYAVHLNKSALAGTFALNCAYLGIPCIGYNNTDTQAICHPYTSCDLQDLVSARKMATQLKNDTNFYNMCSEIAQKKYREEFSEQVWLARWNEIMKRENICL